MTTAITEQGEKVRENRLRRMAQRQGLALVKSRRRDPRALDYRGYWLSRVDNGRWLRDENGREVRDIDDVVVLGGVGGVTLDEVEAYLKGER
ncbi:MAG: hypothetical protein ABSG93_18875 [Solirubrobacteraceae bacterium]|jgi:hypothetical protein